MARTSVYEMLGRHSVKSAEGNWTDALLMGGLGAGAGGLGAYLGSAEDEDGGDSGAQRNALLGALAGGAAGGVGGYYANNWLPQLLNAPAKAPAPAPAPAGAGPSRLGSVPSPLPRVTRNAPLKPQADPASASRRNFQRAQELRGSASTAAADRTLLDGLRKNLSPASVTPSGSPAPEASAGTTPPGLSRAAAPDAGAPELTPYGLGFHGQGSPRSWRSHAATPPQSALRYPGAVVGPENEMPIGGLAAELPLLEEFRSAERAGLPQPEAVRFLERYGKQ